MSVSKTKKARRELAIKKARRNKILAIVGGVLVVAGIAGFLILQHIQRGEAEVYRLDGQSVRLYENGKFAATLSHNTTKSGSYSRTPDGDGGNERIAFTSGNKTEVGRIVGNELHLPTEWDDGHSHGSVFQRSGS